MKKKIYVAAKFEKKDEALNLMNVLKNNGYHITCDWTKHEWPEHYQKQELYSKNIEITNAFAEADIKGVTDADIVIVLYHGIKGPGMSFEMGYATALNKPVYIVGDDTKEYSIFCHLNNFKHFEDIDALLDYDFDNI